MIDHDGLAMKRCANCAVPVLGTPGDTAPWSLSNPPPPLRDVEKDMGPLVFACDLRKNGQGRGKSLISLYVRYAEDSAGRSHPTAIFTATTQAPGSGGGEGEKESNVSAVQAILLLIAAWLRLRSVGWCSFLLHFLQRSGVLFLSRCWGSAVVCSVLAVTRPMPCSKSHLPIPCVSRGNQPPR
jgi:hypothetical protein